jgi:competence protein ComEA
LSDELENSPPRRVVPVEFQGFAEDEARRASLGASIAKGVYSFSKAHLAGIGIVLLAGCLWATYSVTQVQSAEIEQSPPEIAISGGGSPQPASPSASTVVAPSVSPTPPAKILVHVIGEVAKPGVVSVPGDARVQDVIAAVGGFTDKADPAQLNLAAAISDGMQIVIGSKKKPQGEIRGGAATSAATGSGMTGAKISLNQASQSELEALPGVGPVMAGKIIAWREEHGQFTSVAQLQQISGIGAKIYAQIAPNVAI